MLNLFKNTFHKLYSSFAQKISSLFTRTTLDDDFLYELKKLFISADMGTTTTHTLINDLKKKTQTEQFQTPEELKKTVRDLLLSYLPCNDNFTFPPVIMLVGINGSGKTTSAAKLAFLLQQQKKKVLLVGADTFRAAATQQLQKLARKIDVPFFSSMSDDPAAIVFDACTLFEQEAYDHLIIDSAGRLQTKKNLMRELEKIQRVIKNNLCDKKLSIWLTLDAMLGQNSLAQAHVFHETTTLDGIILTKLDGTGKGGIIFAVAQELKLPIRFITFGEDISDIAVFNPHDFVHRLLPDQ